MLTGKLSEHSLLELAQIIKLNERSVWLINRARNRKDILALNAQISNIESGMYIQQVLDEITLRTGKSCFKDLQLIVKNAIKEQDTIWDNQWKELRKEGVVFKNKKYEHMWEVIRTYLPSSHCMGPKEYIFARLQGELHCRLVDDRDIPQLEKVESKSIYLEYQNIVKFNQENEYREPKNNKTTLEWHNIYGRYDLFEHIGFNDVFETIEHLNKPQATREYKNEIILAKSQKNGLYYEFTPKDLPLIKHTTKPAIYTIKDGCLRHNTLDQIGIIRPQK